MKVEMEQDIQRLLQLRFEFILAIAFIILEYWRRRGVEDAL